MSASDLVRSLSAQGVELWFEGDRLRFRSPKGVLTAEQRSDLSRQKADVLAHLRAEAVRTTTTSALSFSQQALWFLHQQAPHSAAYHIAMSVRILSVIDEAALRWALQALVDRHAILRTTYLSTDSGPVQRVSGYAPVSFDVYSADADDAALHSRVEADYRRPFDLEHGPLLRVSLYRRHSAEHVMLLTIHHIAADGWSLLMLFEELFKFYAEFAGGQAAALPRPERQFSDYVAWQTELLKSPEHDRMWAYWSEKLAPPRAVLDLPADRPRPSTQTFRGATLGFELSAEQTARLKEFARREGVTLFVLLLASFQALLHRLTGVDDVTVGTPVFARSKAEFMAVVGDFVNPLPLRARLDQGLTFRGLVSQVKQSVNEALDAQEFPLPLLVQGLRQPRDAGRTPLFDSFFVFQRFDQFRHIEELLVGGDSDAVAELGGLRLAPYPLAQQEGQFDLALQMLERAGILHGGFKYSPDLFDESTIARTVAVYTVLLHSALEEPDRELKTLSILPPAERHWLNQVNATDAPYPDEILPRLFEHQVAQTPERVAVRYQDTRLTYQELNARANRLAHRLRELGVRSGMLVAICLPRSSDLLVALLAVQKAGGAYVPLDPGFPVDRLTYMLTDSGARVLVTDDLGSAAMEIPADVRAINLAAESDQLKHLSSANLPGAASPADAAYVIYTSGSTGRPKGVVVPHGALVNFLWSMKQRPGLGEHDVLAAVTTISFDIAGLELYLPLLVGACIEIVPGNVTADGEALARLLESSGVTVLQATPATWRMLIEAGWPGRPALRALCGGEGLPRELANSLLDRVGELWNLYGPTETTVWSTLERVERGTDPITIGRPIANTAIYVLDATAQQVPIGVAGEIWIGGDGVALGYHNQVDLTRDRFVPDPFSDRPGGRMYRTGDLGRWGADGALQHLGRLDHQVKIRGFRIELGEIESVMARAAGVRENVVVATARNQGEMRLVAYVAAASPPPAVSDLRKHLVQALPEYMVPSSFVFVDKLPLTNNGKVDRGALPAPDAADVRRTEEFQAPATDTQKAVADVFAGVLGMAAVGVHDNFFEIGGHSLLATRALMQLRERFKSDIPLIALFQAPTVYSLSRWLDGTDEEKESLVNQRQWKCLVPTQSDRTGPPLFIVTGYHDPDDTLRILANLIPYVSSDQPLCGLRPRWLDGQSSNYSSVYEMADDYLVELRAFQPRGPYYLIGDCVGGVAAVQVAQRLVEEGDEVALLILIDTERPRAHSVFLHKLTGLWNRGRHIAQTVRQLVRPTAATRRQMVSEIWHRKLRRARLTKTPITSGDHIYEQRLHYHELLKRHRLKRYPGHIKLIVSEDVYRYLWLLGWNDFADGGLEVIRTPGTHQTFRYQYSKEFGVQLRSCIDRVRSEGAKREANVANTSRGDASARPIPSAVSR